MLWFGQTQTSCFEMTYGVEHDDSWSLDMGMPLYACLFANRFVYLC